MDRLQTMVERTPDVTIDARVDRGVITAGPLTTAATLPGALRDAFVSGQWNPTAMLLGDFQKVRDVARGLKYISGF
jgi:hypothetical protein